MNIARGLIGAAVCALAISKVDAAHAEDNDDRLDAAFFGGRGAMSQDLRRVPQWSALLAREAKAGAHHQTKTPAKPQPRLAAPPAKNDSKMMIVRHDAAQVAPPPQEVGLVADVERINREINGEVYRSDESNWRQRDYWETSSELRTQGGDCEDFATAKYFALRQLGIAAEDMRVTIVVDDSIGVRHAILLVRIEGETYALDNRRDRLVRSAELIDYRPLVAMNERAWWIASPELRQARSAATMADNSAESPAENPPISGAASS